MGISCDDKVEILGLVKLIDDIRGKLDLTIRLLNEITNHIKDKELKWENKEQTEKKHIYDCGWKI